MRQRCQHHDRRPCCCCRRRRCRCRCRGSSQGWPLQPLRRRGARRPPPRAAAGAPPRPRAPRPSAARRPARRPRATRSRGRSARGCSGTTRPGTRRGRCTGWGRRLRRRRRRRRRCVSRTRPFRAERMSRRSTLRARLQAGSNWGQKVGEGRVCGVSSGGFRSPDWILGAAADPMLRWAAPRHASVCAHSCNSRSACSCQPLQAQRSRLSLFAHPQGSRSGQCRRCRRHARCTRRRRRPSTPRTRGSRRCCCWVSPSAAAAPEAAPERSSWRTSRQ